MNKKISIICSSIVFLYALSWMLYGLIYFGLGGILFILPFIFALLIIVLDFFVTIGRVKKGLIYSYISSLLKIGIIGLSIPTVIHDFKYEMQYGISNLRVDITLIVMLIIATVPSILNIISSRKH